MHVNPILLDLTEWILLVGMFVIGILIQPYEGDGRGERHPGRRRRVAFYASIGVTALCVCKLLEARYKWQFMWGLFAFVTLGRAIWSVEGKRLHRYMRMRGARIKTQPQS